MGEQGRQAQMRAPDGRSQWSSVVIEVRVNWDAQLTERNQKRVLDADGFEPQWTGAWHRAPIGVIAESEGLLAEHESRR